MRLLGSIPAADSLVAVASPQASAPGLLCSSGEPAVGTEADVASVAVAAHSSSGSDKADEHDKTLLVEMVLAAFRLNMDLGHLPS